MSRYYVTTPIYYVNDDPHIGHAYTTLACDALARFMRLDGRDVRFLTGTDEHGQKVEKAAAEKGIDPQSFTDEISKNFRRLADVMNFSYDDLHLPDDGTPSHRLLPGDLESNRFKTVAAWPRQHLSRQICRLVRRAGRSFLYGR